MGCVVDCDLVVGRIVGVIDCADVVVVSAVVAVVIPVVVVVVDCATVDCS